MNYTYAEMKEMQEKAFERVREMQKRADDTAKQAMLDMRTGTAELPPDPVSSAKKVPDQPKRYSMPVEFPEREQKNRSEKTVPKLESSEKLFSVGNGDKESALLLTLLMLLNDESADKELMFALMYILG